MRLGAMIGLAAALLFVGLAPAGCSSSGASPAAMDGSGVCTGPMSEVSQGCPATFTGSLNGIACVPNVMLGTYVCEDLTVLVGSGGYTGAWCVYDSTTHVLVGARESSDVNEYCGNSSFKRTAGRFPDDACFATTPAATRTCPPLGADAGADLADGGGVSE